MAYNEALHMQVIDELDKHKVDYEVKKMFGGVCYMVADKMCMGIIGDELMVRFDPAMEEEIFSINGCRPMDFTKRHMKGYGYVSIAVLKKSKDFDYWIQLCMDYNKIAKSAKKKTKKK